MLLKIPNFLQHIYSLLQLGMYCREYLNNILQNINKSRNYESAAAEKIKIEG